MNASIPVEAVRKSGRLSVNSGSSTAISGIINGWQIIYFEPFDAEDITNEDIVRNTIYECFQQCRNLNIKTLAMDAIGAEHEVLSFNLFVEILSQTMIKLAPHLGNLKELIIAVRNKKHAELLKKAFVEVLDIKIP